MKIQLATQKRARIIPYFALANRQCILYDKYACKEDIVRDHQLRIQSCKSHI